MALCGTWFDSPEMQNELLRAVTMTLPSSYHWYTFVQVTSHLLHPPVSASLQSLKRNADHSTAVVSNNVPWVVKYFYCQWAAVPAGDGDLISKVTWCGLRKRKLHIPGPLTLLFAHYAT